MSSSTIVVRGIGVRIEEAGDGSPLTLVHGLGGPSMWQKIMAPLSRRFHVLSIHLPGFGESECPPMSFNTDRYAEFLSDLFDALHIRKTSLAGISYGAEIAAVFAAQFPGRVEKLMLIASTGLDEHRFLNTKFIWKIFSAAAKHVVLNTGSLTCLLGRFSFYNIQNRPKDVCKEFYRQISGKGKADAWLNALKNAVTGERTFKEKLQSLGMPTLILWGRHDSIIAPRFAEEFHRLIPNSTLQMVNACGHSVPLEQPEEIVERIVRFSLTNPTIHQ